MIIETKYECSQHKKEPIVIDLSQNTLETNRLLCSECFSNMQNVKNAIGFQTALNFVKDQQQQLNPLNELITMEILRIKTSLDDILCLKKKFQVWIKQLEVNLENQFKELNKLQKQITEIDVLQEINYLTDYQQHKQVDYIKQKKDKYFQIRKQFYQSLTQSFNELLIQLTKTKEQLSKIEFHNQSIINNNNQIINPSKCEIKQLQIIKLKEKCQSIAINYNGDYIAIGCLNKIRIYKNIQNEIIEIKHLEGHQTPITCLIFSKYNNWLLSGGSSQESDIRLWRLQKEQWEIGQIGKFHKEKIDFFILNKNEQLLFSSSGDNSIGIWQINYQSNSIQFLYQLKESQSIIKYITLNESEDNLISLNSDKNINIWKLQPQNNEYKHIQTIKMNQNGVKLIFIQNTQFIWQQKNTGTIKYFKQNQNDMYEEDHNLQYDLQDEYQKDFKSKQIQYPNNNYQTLSQIILLKHKQQIHLLKSTQSGELIKLNQLIIQNEEINANISYNGSTMVLVNQQEILFYLIQYQ